jgi:hypothetical protein
MEEMQVSLLNAVTDSVTTVFRERPITSDMVLGIVSGIVTGMLIYSFSILWKRILVPWYEERVYRGLDISGEWNVKHPHPDEADMQWAQAGVLTLRQTAHRLTGTMTLTPKDTNSNETRTFLFSGEISDRFIWAWMSHSERSRLGYAVALLEVVGDGRSLKGRQVHYDVLNDVIDTAPTEYTRQRG